MVMAPTEASVMAVLYAAVVGLFVYREIRWGQLPEILIQSAAVTGAVRMNELVPRWQEAWSRIGP
jgi:TRAP-type C4-dicarboxylate transport system permease large subunit